MTGKVERLIYASKWAPGVADHVDEIVLGILGASIANNRAAELTGLLVVHDGWFVQALEGSQQQIARRMDQIFQDRRHKEVRIVSSGFDTGRAFSDWDMVAAKVGREADPLLTELGMLAHFNGHNLDGASALRLLFAVGDAERQRERLKLRIHAAQCIRAA